MARVEANSDARQRFGCLHLDRDASVTCYMQEMAILTFAISVVVLPLMRHSEQEEPYSQLSSTSRNNVVPEKIRNGVVYE
jgi:hypothetical protein